MGKNIQKNINIPSMVRQSEVVLVIVARTDDETLGVGGTIARHVENGDIVYGMSMTNGVGSREGKLYESIQQRREAALRAANILGLTWLVEGNFPDNEMDTISMLSVTKVIESVKDQIKPTIVYTHSMADLNIDHRIVAQATFTAFRPQPYEVWKEIRTFEIPSATDYGHKDVTASFYPNLYVSIEKTWDAKLRALKEYSSEMRSAPHTRSLAGVQNLAKYRGNQVGVVLAEAFQIIRKVER